ncbi:carboxymuconolactone decarboxylase family protein [Pseudonocardia benzenivorans]|uniref:Carboxymuconolactone decarboxylase n=2 Tax=Pseudonocardia TaxID=1847 RepID=F4CJQ4_PSEUX|nr:carboxymuconolactone decarboxylase family protein [Pseudonocardia dioxanivorans]AEA25914.1 Carboxymuconolactone decarboxylase [Pseudonocardia dioxanivorans CB1190]GJF06327.1 4-carboxymuconolactone decarboxylase [Pseudonocardia sp. D17]
MSGEFGPGSAHWDAGLDIRRDVVGPAHVERSMAAVSEFSRPIQEFVTGALWGGVWTREGLDRRTRSLLTIVMLTALNRNHELSVHVRGAVRNGCTEEEIREALLQTVAYCGAPAALEAFRVAEKTLGEISDEDREAGAAATTAAGD